MAKAFGRCGSVRGAISLRKVQTAKAKDEILVSGTWDFKWPKGTTIVVAFQEPLAGGGQHHLDEKALREQIQKKIESLVQPWLKDTSLGFRFAGDLVPREFKGKPVVKYDLLVSLDPLPENEPPASELGTYAKRKSYGVPTLKLGYPANLTLDQKPLAFKDYFESTFFKHTVVHEFGHALGIVHTHQHPQAQFTFRDYPEVRELCLKRLGMHLTHEEYEQELAHRWEANPVFSDFGLVPDKNVQSVMANAWFKSFLKDGDPDAPPEFFAEPQAYDLELVRRMYPL